MLKWILQARVLPLPSPGDLPNPRIEPGSPAFQEDALTSEPPGKNTLIFINDEYNGRLRWQPMVASSGTPYNSNVGVFDIVPKVSETFLSTFHSFYFILLFRSYCHHFIFLLADSFFCFIYSVIDFS